MMHSRLPVESRQGFEVVGAEPGWDSRGKGAYLLRMRGLVWGRGGSAIFGSRSESLGGIPRIMKISKISYFLTLLELMHAAY